MDFVRQLVPAAIRRRYAVKFGIALLLLGLSVGLIGFVATAGITTQVEDRVQSDHASFAGQEAQNLQMWNEQNEHTIGSLARSDAVASDDPARIQERFLDWEEHQEVDIFSISYVDTGNGTVLASTDDVLRGQPIDEIEGVPVEAHEQAGEAVPWVSKAYTADGEFGQETAVITYVMQTPDDRDRTIVYTADLESYATRLDEDEHVTTMVLDGNDEVMLDNAGYGEDHATLGHAYGGGDEILTSARTEGASTMQIDGSTATAIDDADGTYGFTDEEYVVSSARVLGTDWVVVTHEPTAEAYGFVTAVDQYGTYATLLGVLLIGMVGAVLGRNTAVSIDRLTDRAGKMERGDLDVDLETKRIDNIGRLYQGFDSMRVALREQIEEAEAAREEAERERQRVQEINDSLEAKAAEYSAVMGDAADGDLTARADTDCENEAMEQIGEDFNEMLEEIEGTVAELNRFATDVATASEQVTASSEEVRSASQQVTESIQEISDGAERQNDSLQSVNQEMSALSTTTEEIASSSNEVADIAEQTVDTGQEGQEAAQEAIAAMDEIEIEAEGAVSEIRRLEDEVQQIDELIATISEIARQTNMLALNANIEASRSASAEEDEGFAVVAKEVKTLSEDAADAADEAEDRLEAIRERTEQSAAEVEGTSDRIEAASDQVQAAVESLEEIADLADETNVGVQEISAATEEQAASTQEVVAMVDDAATISEETTSEAENVAAAAEEQTTALTEVTRSASNLSEQAAELSEALDRFDTDVDRAALQDRDPSIVGDESPETTVSSGGSADGVESFDSDQELTLESDAGTSDPVIDDAGTDDGETDGDGSTTPPTETDESDSRRARSTREAVDDESGELGAEDILGLGDESDATADDAVAGDASVDDEDRSLPTSLDDEPVVAPPVDADDVLGRPDDGADEPVSDADIAGSDATDADTTSEPLPPVGDDADAAAVTEADDAPDDAEPAAEDDTDDPDDTESATSEDVFTFGGRSEDAE